MSARTASPPTIPAELAADLAKARAALSRADTATLAALEPLCDRLEQVGAHEALADLVTIALDRAAERGEEPPSRLPRFLLHAAEGLGDPHRLHEALGIAHRHKPKDPALALRWARSLEERGEHEAGLDVVARALAGLLKEDDPQTLDGVLVTLLEAGDPHRLAVSLPTLGTLLRRGETKRILPFLELAGENLVHPAVRDAAWQELARAARELPPTTAEALRPQLVRVARARLGTAAANLVATSGLEPPQGGLPEAVSRLDDLALRAPGTYHEHNSWGVGRVTVLEADAVTLDFPKRAGQRMTLAAAKSALRPLPANDLRVLGAWQPAELVKMRKEDPVGMLVGVLSSLKREATVTEMKKLLLAWGTIANAEWTSFWQSAKKKAADDPRLDSSHAFEQRYSLASADAGVRIPEFPRHEAPRRAMALLKRLLSQHPASKPVLHRTWGPGLERWADASRTSVADRVAARCWSAELDPDPSRHDGAGIALVAEALTGDFDFADLPGPPEQRRALDWGLRGPSWENAARSALASRLADVRELAFQAIEERHGKDGPAFWEAVWLDAAQAWSAALYVLEHADPARRPVASLAAANPWMGVRGLVNLLESAPEDPIPARATALLAPDGWLARACREHPADEALETLLTRRSLTWKTTERYLDPILAFAESVGLQGLLTRLADARRARARAKSGAADDRNAAAFGGRNLMTRRVYERTRQELSDLENALKTSIPAAIQKARELGDLKENAEYHSAKLKQSTAEGRVLQLAERLREVALIDELKFEPDLATPGTEVDLDVAGSGPATWWILGEGDGELGPEVVSYRAALGKALIGRRVGDTVHWQADGEERTGVLRAVRPRPPA
ncbi:MAG: GreA/GreB family elongation factor [Candidatus Eisenbacteria bacterium]